MVHFLFFIFLFPVPGPGFADVQTLRGLRHLHLPLHLFDPDACREGVSVTSVSRHSEVLHLHFHCEEEAVRDRKCSRKIKFVLRRCETYLDLLTFCLRQPADVGDVIRRAGLCAAADPGHLLRRSPAGQCAKSQRSLSSNISSGPAGECVCRKWKKRNASPYHFTAASSAVMHAEGAIFQLICFKSLA